MLQDVPYFSKFHFFCIHAFASLVLTLFFVSLHNSRCLSCFRDWILADVVECLFFVLEFGFLLMLLSASFIFKSLDSC